MLRAMVFEGASAQRSFFPCFSAGPSITRVATAFGIPFQRFR